MVAQPKRWDEMSITEKVESLRERLDGLAQALGVVEGRLKRRMDEISNNTTSLLVELKERIETLEEKTK